MPTHGFYNGCNPTGKPLKAAGNADFQYSVYDPAKGVYQGIGAAVHTFFADDLLGTPATLYIFQGAPLFSLSSRLALGYEWNLGLSSGWKNNGAVTVSPLNVYINLAALFTWKMNNHWDFIFGPEYTHFSNGDTKFPNGGANTVNLRFGARRQLRPSETIRTEDIFVKMENPGKFTQRISYDLSFFGGWRSDRTIHDGRLHIFNHPFPVASLNFNPLYHFNGFLSAGPSIDLLYDRSANLIVSKNDEGIASYSHPGFLNQFSAGMSARAELEMPVFAINIGIGYGFQLENHTRYDNDLNALYGIFALKAFVTDRLNLSVSYRLSSVLYSHNMLFGLGWRFGTISHP
jgi:hypothetical protein